MLLKIIRAYRNAQKERNRLLKELAKVREEKSKVKLTKNPAEHCGLIVREKHIEEFIEMLTKILK